MKLFEEKKRLHTMSILKYATPNEDYKHEERPKEFTKEEAQEIFYTLLKDLDINSNTKWEQVEKRILMDERGNVFKSISERKKSFKDYVHNLKKFDRIDQRSKFEAVKEGFYQMLDCSGIVSSDSKFYKTAHMFVHDPRWKAVEERDRENMFQDYLDDCYIREKEDQRIKKRDYSEKLKIDLKNHAEFSVSLKWERFKALFCDNLYFKRLSEYDRLKFHFSFSVFTDLIVGLEQKENDEKRKEKRRTERKNRDSFRELLEEKIQQGYLNHKVIILIETKWRLFVKEIKDETRLWNMLGQPGSTPREIFEDKLEILKNEHKKIKENFLECFAKDSMFHYQDFTFKPETKFEEFEKIVQNEEFYSQLDDLKKKEMYDYFLEKTISKVNFLIQKKEEHLLRKKEKKKFRKFLKTLKIYPNSTFEEFKKDIEDHKFLFPHLKDRDFLKRFEKAKLKAKEPNHRDDQNIVSNSNLKRKNSKSISSEKSKKRSHSRANRIEEGEIVKKNNSLSDEGEVKSKSFRRKSEKEGKRKKERKSSHSKGKQEKNEKKLKK